jgi:quercetin dioxygenase-like cupin family protein
VGGAVQARVLTQVSGSALVEALEISFPAGELRASQAHPAGVVEHLILTSGRLRAGPSGATVELDAGDVLRFAADVAHEYAALDGEPAGALVLMAYPPARAL